MENNYDEIKKQSNELYIYAQAIISKCQNDYDKLEKVTAENQKLSEKFAKIKSFINEEK